MFEIKPVLLYQNTLNKRPKKLYNEVLSERYTYIPSAVIITELI